MNKDFGFSFLSFVDVEEEGLDVDVNLLVGSEGEALVFARSSFFDVTEGGLEV